MLKKAASGVLASLRGSTYHGARAARAARGGWVKKNTPRPRHWALTDSRPSADVTLIILRVADLAAALLDNLFEHPASNSTSGLRYTRHRTLGLPQYLVPQAISQIIR